jgi:hypothetical protein
VRATPLLAWAGRKVKLLKIAQALSDALQSGNCTSLTRFCKMRHRTENRGQPTTDNRQQTTDSVKHLSDKQRSLERLGFTDVLVILLAVFVYS